MNASNLDLQSLWTEFAVSEAGSFVNVELMEAYLTGLAGLPLLLVAVSVATEAVILLHGLCRTRRSMARMAKALEAAGYTAHNVSYPSRTARVEDLADTVISGALTHPDIAKASKVHFVTHSLGGILVRQYLQSNTIPNLGRVVMLGPPNQGSEVVDRIGDFSWFKAMHGPTGNQLSTAPDSTPNQLGPVSFELGIIAGDRSINWINSFVMIDGPDDGKVSVQRTRAVGATDHVVVHVSHPFLMRNKRVIRETLHFLRAGRFSDEATRVSPS